MEKLTPKKVLTDLVAVYREINLLTQDAKSIMEEAKEILPEDTDFSGIDKLAKLMAKEKDGEAVVKMQAFITLAEELA